jgi:methionine biosynthesis protein MetW
MTLEHTKIRPDLQVVANWIEPGSRVLDIGCGNGELLAYLGREKNVDCRGIEIRRAKVNQCVAAGLSVIRGDANQDLSLYPTDSFDYVVLTQALQTLEQPRAALEELIRVGNRAVVSIPNFGYWRVRLSLLFRGRMPVTESLNQPWYETKNIHLCTILDFLGLVQELGLEIEDAVVLKPDGTPARSPVTSARANFWGEQAVLLLRRK